MPMKAKEETMRTWIGILIVSIAVLFGNATDITGQELPEEVSELEAQFNDAGVFEVRTIELVADPDFNGIETAERVIEVISENCECLAGTAIDMISTVVRVHPLWGLVLQFPGGGELLYNGFRLLGFIV
jgi:hypothetical protein